MPSERRPFQTAFLSNRKTVGKLAERVQSRYDGLHKFKHICSAAMAEADREKINHFLRKFILFFVSLFVTLFHFLKSDVTVAFYFTNYI
ncbi:hypothetical protein [Neisseria meningitidis]|uniref:hypothetical protein n=1 Tax=Neisseria meningitidis TaxID=487 RepID=UPI000FCA97B7|nr:hypothetical protein [Neisseria meningitidis]